MRAGLRTLHKNEEKYTDSFEFEMWCYRKLLRVPWTENKINNWILQQLNVDKELLDKVKFLKLDYFYRRKDKRMQLFGKEYVTPGNRSRDRQRRRWSEDISEWTELYVNEGARATKTEADG